MEVGKVIKRRGEDLSFFFFLFVLLFTFLKTTEICFGSTKMGIFHRETAFHAGKKIRKNDFAPSEKYACYTPVSSLGKSRCFINENWLMGAKVMISKSCMAGTSKHFFFEEAPSPTLRLEPSSVDGFPKCFEVE